MVEPDKVRGKGGKQLVDVIALVRHAIDPNTPLAPVGMTVEERYQQWLADKQAAGMTFTADQRKWLDAIKDHIASSLAIEQDDLEEVDVQQGDGAVIESPQGKIILVDGGDNQLFARYLAARFRGTSDDKPKEIDCIL